MIRDNRSTSLRSYRVSLGHTNLLIEGVSQEDAVRQARKQLCCEMPRMWDVIQAMEDTRFQVLPIN